MKKITADPILDVFSVPQILKKSLSLLTLAHRQRNYLGSRDFSRDPPIMGPPLGHPNPECLEIMYPMGSREADMGRPCGGSHRTWRFLEKFLPTPLAEPVNLSLWLDGMFSGTALTSEKRCSHQRSSARSFSNGTTMNLDFKKKCCKPYKMYNEAQIFQTRSKS